MLYEVITYRLVWWEGWRPRITSYNVCYTKLLRIRALAKLGYPLNRMHYYRGGMQMWQILGLTTVVPDPKNMLFADVRGGE